MFSVNTKDKIIQVFFLTITLLVLFTLVTSPVYAQTEKKCNTGEIKLQVETRFLNKELYSQNLNSGSNINSGSG